MRKRSRMLVVGLMLPLCPPSLADSPPSPKKDAPKPAATWKEDPVCKMVFFAVLKGLYEDGVSKEAVDNIVGRTKDEKGEIRHTFVFECPLCHPLYEAFRLYQQRPQFRDKGDTFGKGIDPKLETGLRSTGLRTRQEALQRFVHRWGQRRLDGMGLSDAQKQEWAKRLEERSK